jgi:hypothetical protein
MLVYENDTNQDIKKEFEDFFIREKRNKMNIFEFNKLVDKCEINVAKTCDTLFSMKFKWRLSKVICKENFRKIRDWNLKKHVQTWDQIE